MSKIKILDNLTIEKIAAGEVIERPASIVKELLENSIDAKATEITIEIKDGGKSLIRVTDNGEGIGESDLPLAFKRHSTSKLRKIEDLYKISSLGFRGEALSSISAVAKIKILTKTQSSLAGIEAIIENGSLINQNIVGCPKGTTMIVEDLFYNLPVRKEFLKSDLVESNKISDIIYKIALGNPNIGFTYIKDNKTILRTNRNQDLKNHIYTILGRDFSENLLEISHETEDFKIKGFISNNQYYRGNRSHQYLYINDRYIQNINISKAIERQYKSLIPINRFPVFLIFIYINPSKIDVNIHPTKQEVKFTNENYLIENISSRVKNVLFPRVEVGKIKLQAKNMVKKETIPNLFDFAKDLESSKEIPTSNQDFFIEDLRPVEKTSKDTLIKEEKPSYNTLVNSKDFLEPENDPFIDPSENSTGPTKNMLDNLEPVGIVFNTYIIAEDRTKEKIYFIDQHAAHERVMYEKYLQEFKEENIYIQGLISPLVLNLTNQESNKLIKNIDLFKRLGFDLEEFGNNSIIVRGVPMLFGKPNVENLLLDILDNLGDVTNNYDTRVDKIMKIACVNSVKSGDDLKTEEVFSLFNRLKNCSQPHTCPHGRPTILEMSKKHIEKEFLRIM